jgi:hypothetical protein
VRSSCRNASEVVRLELVGGEHVIDSRMARYTWEFLKQHKRVTAPSAISQISAASTSGPSSAPGGQPRALSKHSASAVAWMIHRGVLFGQLLWWLL